MSGLKPRKGANVTSSDSVPRSAVAAPRMIAARVVAESSSAGSRRKLVRWMSLSEVPEPILIQPSRAMFPSKSMSPLPRMDSVRSGGMRNNGSARLRPPTHNVARPPSDRSNDKIAHLSGSAASRAVISKLRRRARRAK